MTAEELYEKLRDVKVNGSLCAYSLEKCASLVPLINAINEIKKARNAVILAHSYVAPEIVYGVADYTGDSYGLSKDAMGTTAKTIVFSAVRFMGETAKILNPDKEVLIPGKAPGCSLADSVTGDDVRRLKQRFPDHAFVCYINTTADVKAECDVCVTSSNVYDIVERFPNDKIVFLPDKLMGKNLKDEMERRGVKKDIQLYDGVCYVHEQYDPEMVTYMRVKFPGLEVVSHPECSAPVAGASDFVGSTSQILTHVGKSKQDTFLVLTECGLINRLEAEHPKKRFVGSCTMCKYMKSNSLEDILRVLVKPRPEDRVELDEEVRVKAQRSIEAMFRYTEMAVAKHG
ncbi:MAG TPA: quinolinate synthase NadA [Fibrobacteria bacterium]|nr:quinolinate synthase NadA [Fibrobacteria bacterium]